MIIVKEILDNPAPYKQTDKYVWAFTVDKVDYTFEAHFIDMKEFYFQMTCKILFNKWFGEDIFKELHDAIGKDFSLSIENFNHLLFSEKLQSKFFDIDFSIAETQNEIKDFSITGTGNASIVFATVVQIIDDFIRQDKPILFMFSAESASRFKLYTTMTRIISKKYKNYEYDIGSNYFYIYNERLLENVIVSTVQEYIKK